MKMIAFILAFISVSVFAQPSIIPSGQRLVYGEVIESFVIPLFGEVCDTPQEKSYVAPVVGGLVGAIIGNRFGGKHKNAATAAGAVAGAMVGNEYANNQQQEQQLRSCRTTSTGYYFRNVINIGNNELVSINTPVQYQRGAVVQVLVDEPK